MDYASLLALAKSVGLDGHDADIAASVALAESGGNPAAIGDVDKPHAGCRSYGLWQINSCPDRDKTGVRSNTAALLTPAGNAAAMKQISANGHNWSPWTTYRNGAYQQYLGGGTGTGVGQALGAASAVGSGIADTASSVLDSLGSFVSLFQFLVNPSNWLRAALFVLGLVIVIIGVIVTFSGTDTGRDTEGVAAQAAAVA